MPQISSTPAMPISNPASSVALRSQVNTATSGSPDGSAATAQTDASRDELRSAAQAFEAIMLRQFFASARATDFGGEDIMGGQGMEQFTAMRDEHLADIASQTGAFGLAASIETQLAAMKGMR